MAEAWREVSSAETAAAKRIIHPGEFGAVNI